MKIAIGCDHAGFELKKLIKKYLEKDHEIKDVGTFSNEPADYPDLALLVAKTVARGEVEKGILICGTGIGMCITANKISGIRAALCHDVLTAKLSREHNDANILCLGARILDKNKAIKIVRVWLNTKFDARHAKRIKKIKAIESKYFK